MRQSPPSQMLAGWVTLELDFFRSVASEAWTIRAEDGPSYFRSQHACLVWLSLVGARFYSS